MPVKQITYTRLATKALAKMQARQRSTIVSKINAYAKDPSSQANNVKKLQGRTGIRLRVGDYRVIMEDGKVLAVLDVGPRGSIY